MTRQAKRGAQKTVLHQTAADRRAAGREQAARKPPASTKRVAKSASRKSPIPDEKPSAAKRLKTAPAAIALKQKGARSKPKGGAEEDVFESGVIQRAPELAMTAVSEAVLQGRRLSGLPTVHALPGRVEEFDSLCALVGDAVRSGQGTCVYISGVPGTGKTATLRQAVRRMLAETDAFPVFDFVEINGMKLGDALHAYSALWDRVSLFERERNRKSNRGRPCKLRSRKNQSATTALRRLVAHFEARRDGACSCGAENALTSPDGEALERGRQSRAPCRPLVLLLDEFDQLLARRSAMMYHFFEWTGWQHSQLVVIAVANTMDLPERMLSHRVASRMGTNRLNFRPYTYPQLMEIILYHLRVDASSVVRRSGKAQKDTQPAELLVAAGPGQPAVAFRPDALEYCARKISAVSGDARRALSLARRAVALAVLRQRKDPSADARGALAPVTIAIVEQALRLACAGNAVQQITDLSLREKVMLAATVMCVRARAAQTSLNAAADSPDAAFGAPIIPGAGACPLFGDVAETHMQFTRTHGLSSDCAASEDAFRDLQRVFGNLETAGLVARPQAASGVLPCAPSATAACVVRLSVTEEEVAVALRPLPMFAQVFAA